MKRPNATKIGLAIGFEWDFFLSLGLARAIRGQKWTDCWQPLSRIQIRFGGIGVRSIGLIGWMVAAQMLENGGIERAIELDTHVRIRNPAHLAGQPLQAGETGKGNDDLAIFAYR